MTLIDRLSKLEGPDREVDAEICILFQYGGENSEGATNVRIDPDWCDDDLLFEIDGDPCCNPIPKVTASVDTAIALAERVLPGQARKIVWEEGRAIVVISQATRLHEVAPTIVQTHDHAAIALCIAILRAKEASKP